MKKSGVLTFNDAFKYPFNKAKRMWNILWLFLPIFGWFALGGYSIRIIQEFTKGKFENLPEMTFGSDMKLGFFMLLKAIPFMVAYVIIVSILIAISPALDAVFKILFALFMLPMLSINFMKKMTIESFFEFGVVSAVFDNLGDYVVAVLKSLALVLIFLVMIIVLVGIPASMFTKNIFLADFYRRRVKS